MSNCTLTSFNLNRASQITLSSVLDTLAPHPEKITKVSKWCFQHNPSKKVQRQGV